MVVVGAAAWGGGLAARADRGLLLAALGSGLLVGLVAVGVLRGRGVVLPSGVRRTASAALLVAVVVGGVTAAHHAAASAGPVAGLAEQRAVVSLVGSVHSDPVVVAGRFADQTVVRLEVHEVEGRGHRTAVRSPVLVLGGPGWLDVPLGAEVGATGRLAPADDPALAGLLTDTDAPTVRAGPDPWWRAAAHVRAGVRDAVAHRPDDQRALVPALVDGDDAALDPGLEADFRTTGLTHLTAVSGTNLTLLLAFVLALARGLGVRGRGLLVVGLLGVAGFVLLARTEPSVLRAAVMGVVGLLALRTDGRRRGPRALGVAVVVLLLLDPDLAVAAGFALSVLATAGIVLLGPSLRGALARWLPGWVADAVAVPLAAQLACTPVVAAISSQVSLVAVGANLLVAPVVGPATVLGLAGGLVALVAEPLARVLGTLAGWCVAWIVVVAERGADLPLAAVGWGTGATALGLLTAAVLLTAWLAPRVLARPWLAVPVAVVAVLVCVVGVRSVPGLPGGRWPPAGWAVVACDVGQGDALALRAGEHAAVVVDAGPDPDAVDRCLDDLGVDAVPLVVLTHFHADHVDGLPGVLDDRRVGEVWTTSLADPASGVATVDDAASGVVTPRPAVTGAAVTVGDVSLQVLWPPAGRAGLVPGDSSAANDASVVLLAEVDGLRVLLTGDVEPAAQAALAASIGDPAALGVDVLKVPHHGSAHQDLDLLTGLGADVALVSVGADNDYGHPAPVVIDDLETAGTEVHRTDDEGDLAVLASGQVETAD